eukprot:3960574-Pleurochrysis_carterae.AAC.5
MSTETAQACQDRVRCVWRPTPSHQRSRPVPLVGRAARARMRGVEMPLVGDASTLGRRVALRALPRALPGVLPRVLPPHVHRLPAQRADLVHKVCGGRHKKEHTRLHCSTLLGERTCQQRPFGDLPTSLLLQDTSALRYV